MLLFYSAASLIEIRKWNPQASGLAQPPGSGAEVQSLATLLWGLTPEVRWTRVTAPSSNSTMAKRRLPCRLIGQQERDNGTGTIRDNLNFEIDKMRQEEY